MTITFEDDGAGSLFLDHRGTRIHHLDINGRSIEPDWTGYRLTLLVYYRLAATPCGSSMRTNTTTAVMAASIHRPPGRP
ncbi:MAG: hypothetical protein U0531_10000 [Dehalococcoidia bacterium]